MNISQKDCGKLKQVIQQANPEIMELQFGCEIENGYAAETNPHRIGMFVQHIFRTARVNPGSHIRLTNGKDFWETPKNNDKLKILGRPIRLADVLLTLRKVRKEIYMRSDGIFFNWYKFASPESGHNEVKSTYIEWNLKNDNLDNQSDETKQFLIDLLVTK